MSPHSKTLSIIILVAILATSINITGSRAGIASHLVINEVQFNPSSDPEEYQFVEIFNPTGETVDLNGWHLDTYFAAGNSLTFPHSISGSIGPGKYWVKVGGIGLDPAGGYLVLKNAQGIEVDRTRTLTTGTTHTDNSWQRYPNGEDADSDMDWSQRLATKGKSNDLSSTTPKETSTITIAVSNETASQNERLTISGAIFPKHIAVDVMVNFTVPPSDSNPQTTTRTSVVKTDTNGTYTTYLEPDVAGTWRVESSWTGDDTHTGAASSSENILVNASPGSRSYVENCVIATATYGGPYASEVVFMRHVRDDMIGSNPVGSVLVEGWNKFYYSWSPPVASAIAGSAFLKPAFTVLLLPLLGTMHVIAFQYECLSPLSPQLASIVGFATAAVLAIGIYLFVPAWIFRTLIRQRLTERKAEDH